MNETLKSALSAADPVAGEEDAMLHELVQRMTVSVRRTATALSPTPTPWWKRRRLLIPIGIPAVIALTGAAVVIPLGLWINGTEADLDAEIPIVYTTDTGVDVNCRAGIYFGDPVNRTADDDKLAEFVNDHNWTGIGQRIYEEAIANPFVPGPNDDLEVDNQDLRDSFSFTSAMSLIWEEIPAEMRQTGQQAALTSDCTGQLR